MNAAQARRTKLALTLGSASLAVVRELVVAGMDLARIDLATGSAEEHKELVHAIRSAAHSARRSVAVMLELPADAGANLAEALELRPDLICRPVATIADIAGLRNGLPGQGPPVVAKLTTPAAVEGVQAVLELAAGADGVMLVGHDFENELGDFQDRAMRIVVDRATEADRFVIIGGHLLAGMADAAEPSAAEVLAVVSAASLAPDALLIGAATESGRYPVEAAKALAKLAATTDDLGRVQEGKPSIPNDQMLTLVTALALTEGDDHNIDAIWCFTRSGKSAQMLAAHLHKSPVVAFTVSPTVARRLAVLRGIMPVLLPGTGAGEPLVKRMEAALKAQGGDTTTPKRIVLVTTSDQPGGINRLEFHRLL